MNVMSQNINNNSNSSIYTKIQIPTSTGAMCLDGTPQIFYWKQGFGTGSNKFIVYFEGGGWCYGLSLNDSIQNCYERSLTFMGSTFNDTPTANYSLYGILSSDATLNPNFYNYNVAFIRYCDGTGHQGYAKEPVIYNNSQIYFRGHNNTIEILNTLITTYNMSEPEILLISGDSAGGLATYNWISYVQQLFDGKNTKVLAAPDSGLFLDFIDEQTQNFTYKESFQNMMLLSNQEADPINTNILGEPCIFQNQINSLSPCNYTEYQAVMSYKSATLTTIINILNKNHQNNWGAWAPACVFHVLSLTPFTFNSEIFNIPMNSNNTLSQSLGQWVSNFENNSQITPENLIFIDSVDWPNNTPCSSTKGGSIFWLFSS